MKNQTNQPDEIMSYSSAKAVATRKNSEIKKRYPLFVDQIEKVTPEQVVEKKKRYKEFSQEHREQREQEELIDIAKAKDELKLLVSDEREFSLLDEKVVERASQYGGLYMSYRSMTRKLRERLKPCPKLALSLLFYLELHLPKEFTHNELSRTFNIDRKLIREHLEWLYDCELVDTSLNGLTPCSITGFNCVHWLARY